MAGLMIDFTKVVRSDSYVAEDEHDTDLVREMEASAKAFLEAFAWCRGAVDAYVGNVAVGGVVAVFLFRIYPARSEVDEWLWVVVGDLPPAYLVTDGAPNPACALSAYLELMGEWVKAAQAGEPVDELIPVLTHGSAEDIPPTAENAEMLASRLEFVEERILSSYRNDLSACIAESDSAS